MKKLPAKIRNKLLRLQKYGEKVRNIDYEINDILQEYGLNTELFTATAGKSIEEQTEALTFIQYGEGNIEDNLKEFERVFLYHVNKKSN